MIQMNYKKLPEDLYQVEYYDDQGLILFEETLTKKEVEVRSTMTDLPDEKFLQALVEHPLEVRNGV